ncbi:MAG: NAD-dependent epimerase/dehydratase family protein, partial [Betaproteobacteria bacterium]|nr:NAD-dependent epimerase/dehydratase family protein [Betaproteobacteria bacterium]
MSKKKVLILGGAGFVGMHLAKFIAQHREHELTIADHAFGRNAAEYFTPQQLDRVRFVQGDFSQAAAFDQFDTDYDHFYMLASVVGVNPTLESPEEVLRINTLLILNSLEWLKRSRVKKALFSSTSEAYSGTTEVFDYPVPTDETVPLCIQDVSQPRFSYAITKIFGESAFLNYARKFDFDATVVRYHNAFGPDMGFKHVIPHLVERFLKKENPFKIYGHDQTRAFSFIDDSVEGTVLAMESEQSNGGIFHLGSSVEISIETLVRAVGDILGFEGEYEMAPTYPGSVSRRCPDISKARRVLGYDPKVDWATGLRRTVDWYVAYFATHEKAASHGFKAP